MDIKLTVLCEIIDQCLSLRKKIDIGHVLRLIGKLAPCEAAIFLQFDIESGLIKSMPEFVGEGCQNEWLALYRQDSHIIIDPVVLRAMEEQRAFEWHDAFQTQPYCKKQLSIQACQPGQTKGAAYAYPFAQESGRLSFLSLQVNRDLDTHQYRLILECLLPHIHNVCINDTVATKSSGQMGLSCRELEVLKWVGQGKRSKEIGFILAISENTVKYHLSNVFMKLDVTNRTQAITKAINHKLING